MNFIKFLKFLLIITFVFSTVSGCKKFEWEGDFEPDGKKGQEKMLKKEKALLDLADFSEVVIKEEEEVLNLLHRMNFGEQA